MKLGKDADAEPCYREAIRFDPKRATAQHNLGVVLKKLGKYADAEASFREAIRLDPKYGPAHRNLGRVMKMARREDVEDPLPSHSG